MLGAVRQVDPLADAPLTERNTRQLSVGWKWLIAAALIVMSGFHLYTGTRGLLTAMVQRSTHLAFALPLALLLFPGSPAAGVAGLLRGLVTIVAFPLAWIGPIRARRDALRGRIDAASTALAAGVEPWMATLGFGLTVLTAAAGVVAVGYVGFYHEALARRMGAPTDTDIVVAVVGIALVLEATRRSVSPALFYVTIGFLLYALFGQHLPGMIGHAGVQRPHLLSQLYFDSSDGVFGIPTKVSATFVFLFVLFGAALARSGAGAYLIDLAFATMGRFRGGPAKAAVFASGTMGTISGSSIANTVTTGSLTIPLMKKAGFKPHVAGAVEVAASTNGQLVPPVMGAAAFIMAEITDVPYSRIVIAAALPALLSYLAIFTMIHLNACRTGIAASDPATLPPVGRTLLRGLPLNLPLAAVLVFLLGLALSEAYAASLAIWVTLGVFAGVALAAPTSVYGLHRLADRRAAGEPARYADRLILFGRQTLAAFRDGAMNMIGIACACACCGIIIAVVNQTGLGAKITAIITDLSAGHMLPALLLTALASILLGIGLPTTATYIIMATLTAPALLTIAAPGGAAEISVSLLLAAHLFVFYYGILADDTPPVGLCAYAASGIAGADPIRTGLTSFRFDLAAFMLPLIFFYNRELLLIDVTWREVAWVVPGAVVAMLAFAAALEGWAMGRLAWWMRGLLVVTAFLLIQPGVLQSLAGAGLLGLVLGVQRWRRGAGVRHNGSP